MRDLVSLVVDRASRPDVVRISHDDIIGWAGTVDNWEFYNSVSLALARKYHGGQLSYSLCDRIMNGLWGGVVSGLLASSIKELPEPIYDVYLAFDAGEYHRKADRSDDPVAEFTNPMIAELLQDYPEADSNLVSPNNQ